MCRVRVGETCARGAGRGQKEVESPLAGENYFWYDSLVADRGVGGEQE